MVHGFTIYLWQIVPAVGDAGTAAQAALNLDALVLSPGTTVAEAQLALEASAGISATMIAAYIFLILEILIVLIEAGAIAYYTGLAMHNGASLDEIFTWNGYSSAFGTCYNNSAGFWNGIWTCIAG
jgi:hypothetical protein